MLRCLTGYLCKMTTPKEYGTNLKKPAEEGRLEPVVEMQPQIAHASLGSLVLKKRPLQKALPKDMVTT
nr:hypothetical protein [Tanacetum cinerariifolium]